MNPLARTPSAAVRAIDGVVRAGVCLLLLAGSSSCAPNPEVPARTSDLVGSAIFLKVGEGKDPEGEVRQDPTCRVCVARDSYVAKDFSQLYGCPRDQIRMISRVDTRGIIPPVPPDVTADPDRLALWCRDHIGYAYFDVTGCGERLQYSCILVGAGRRTCS